MGAHPGNKQRLVAGMDVAVAMLFCQPLRVAARVVVALALEDHLGAQVLHRLDLDRVRGGGSADDRAHAEQLGGIRDRLPVVAGGGGDHTPPSLVLA